MNSSNEKQYINIETNGAHINFVFKPTATTVWTWNTELKALVGVCGEKTYFMGTSSTFKTFGMMEVSEASTSYVGQLYIYVQGNEETDSDSTQKEIDLSKYDLISIAQAIEIANAAGSTATTERYYIYGTIKEIKDATYGSMTITDGTNEIYVYGSYDADGVNRYSDLSSKPKKGDQVVISANLCVFDGAPEVKAGWIQEFASAPKENIDLPASGSEITIAQALQIAEQVGEDVTTDRWIIKGTVKTVVNPLYGEMYITDGTDEIYVYGTYSADGVTRYSDMTEKPVAGDLIVLSINLNVHSGAAQAKSGWIQSFEHQAPQINEADYVEKTIAQSRSVEIGSKVKVTGIVSVITYANGRIPDGVIIVDGESSIYVYGRDVAGQVVVGNTITVAAELDHFVAENEKTHANTHGYMGAIQLTNCYLLDNDKTVSTVDLSWAAESTVKEIIDTPYSEPITSLIVKSTAIIVKDEQKGYTNYYIKDLDNKQIIWLPLRCKS